MTRNFLATALAISAFSLPALAADEYFVAKNDSTKKCEVTTTKPDGTAMMQIGTVSYKTEDEAKKAMTEAADCK